ncbi:MAG: hypothetical protein JNL23_07105 [Chitinophagaceae bacterium]|nr:hypothetical protein [Chitinophagaceae bacterium]
MKRFFRYLVILAFGFSSCDPTVDVNPPQEVTGFVPVYSQDPANRHIS